MEFIKRPEQQIPIYAKSEVVVSGVGVVGLTAAVASVRLGCKMVFIE